MTFVKYKTTNNARGTLLAGISAGAGSLILSAGEGGLFPTTGPFLITLEALDATSTLQIKPVTKREVMRISGRSGDTLTIAGRAYEDVAVSDTAVAQSAVAYAFDAGDIVQLRVTQGYMEDIQDETTRLEADKLNLSDYISGAKLFKESNTGNDSYQATFSDITSYAQIDGQILRVRVDTANTNAATFQVSALGAKAIVKYTGDPLTTGDIPANAIIELAWNDDQDYFELVSMIEPSFSATTNSIVDSTYRCGDDVGAGQPVFLESLPTYALATTAFPTGFDLNVGDYATNTRDAIRCIGNGTAFTTFKLGLKKTGTPVPNLVIEIQTDSAGSASGTAVTNATASIASASLTTSFVDTTVTLAGSVTLTAGTTYWIVLKQLADAVSATDFYSVAQYTNQTSTRISKKYSGSAWTFTSPTDRIPTSIYTGTDGVTASRGWRIVQKVTKTLKGVKYFGTANLPTRCILRDSGGSAITTSTTLVGKTFTFNDVLTAGTTYRIEFDANGGSWDFRDYTAANREGNYTTFAGGSNGGSDNSLAGTLEDLVFDVDTYNTDFAYVSCVGMVDSLLSLAQAAYSYKVPKNHVRLANATVNSGGILECVIAGISAFQSGLTQGLTYYVGDTPGVVQNTKGTYPFILGEGWSATKILVSTKLSSRTVSFTYNTATASGNVVISHTLGRQPKKIIFQLYNNSNNSTGTYDNGENNCVWSDASGSGLSATYALRSAEDATDYATGAVTTLTETSFTIAWTKFASATGTVYVLAQLE